MVPDEIRNALIKVTQILQNKVSWAIDGSCALALQGIRVTPHDIDILTDAGNAYRIENILKEFLIREVRYGETDQWRSHFGIFSIDSVKVEIMGDLQSFRDGKWGRIQNPALVSVVNVELDSVNVPVVSLSSLESTGYLQRRFKREQE
ncbi:MAG: hypothetical protein M1498_03730 [Candidatus Thermoplasmatota archaeon]|nr:hypothetical protein [Candidatus Thermoplasmatota archaeon]